MLRGQHLPTAPQGLHPTWRHPEHGAEGHPCDGQHPAVRGHLLQAQACTRAQLQQAPGQVLAFCGRGLTAVASHCPPSPSPAMSVTVNNAGSLEESAHWDPPSALRESVLHQSWGWGTEGEGSMPWAGAEPAGAAAFPDEGSESRPPPAQSPGLLQLSLPGPWLLGSIYPSLGWGWGARSVTHATPSPTQHDPSLDPGVSLAAYFPGPRWDSGGTQGVLTHLGTCPA